MAKKDLKFNCCGEENNCSVDNKCDCNNEKPLKVKFCPKCKSTDVNFVFRLKNLFGLVPRIECNKCGNSSVDFPLLIVKDKKKLKKKENKK